MHVTSLFIYKLDKSDVVSFRHLDGANKEIDGVKHWIDGVSHNIDRANHNIDGENHVKWSGTLLSSQAKYIPFSLLIYHSQV